jgi:HlyD family secretion protein
VNQVVQAGDMLMEITPDHNTFTIKASVAPQDIGSVRTGQMAQLRVSACPYPSYGTLQGTVTAISPDAIATTSTNAVNPSQNGSPTSFYEVTIQPSQTVLQQGDRQCSLQAGMEAEAHIISRQETFLQFGLRKARLLTDW